MKKEEFKKKVDEIVAILQEVQCKGGNVSIVMCIKEGRDIVHLVRGKGVNLVEMICNMMDRDEGLAKLFNISCEVFSNSRKNDSAPPSPSKEQEELKGE